MTLPTRKAVFLTWHAERDNRLAEIGLLLAKAPASPERARATKMDFLSGHRARNGAWFDTMTAGQVVLALHLLVGGSASVATGCGNSPTQSPGDVTGLVGIGGGRELFLRCRGRGTPTVVLISGFRGAYDDW